MREVKCESWRCFLKIETGKSFLDALSGHVSENVPFWFMRQAGRYLPEYRELRAKKGSFLGLAMDPIAACEVTMQPVRRFGMDAAIIFSDILVVPYALGQKLEFVEGEGPKLDPVKSSQEIMALGYKEFETKLSPVYEALRKTKMALEVEGFKKTALIGFAGAPWTVASYMVEGGSSREFTTVKKMAYADPKIFSGLIDLLSEATASYLIRQVEAGAEALQIFDSWAGVLDEHLFHQYVILPTREIVKTVREACPHVPIIGFPRGAGNHYSTYMRETGVTALGLDTSVPVRWAAKTLQPVCPVQGNLDPIALLTGGDSMIRATERILSELSRGPFVFNLGHGIHKETPIEHVEALVQFIKNWRV